MRPVNTGYYCYSTVLPVGWGVCLYFLHVSGSLSGGTPHWGPPWPLFWGFNLWLTSAAGCSTRRSRSLWCVPQQSRSPQPVYEVNLDLAPSQERYVSHFPIVKYRKPPTWEVLSFDSLFIPIVLFIFHFLTWHIIYLFILFIVCLFFPNCSVSSLRAGVSVLFADISQAARTVLGI